MKCKCSRVCSESSTVKHRDYRVLSSLILICLKHFHSALSIHSALVSEIFGKFFLLGRRYYVERMKLALLFESKGENSTSQRHEYSRYKMCGNCGCRTEHPWSVMFWTIKHSTDGAIGVTRPPVQRYGGVREASALKASLRNTHNKKLHSICSHVYVFVCLSA